MLNYLASPSACPQPLGGRSAAGDSSIVLVDVWHFAPFAMLILLAGLRSLPPEPFESAMIDGASRWQIFWRITVPLLQPVLVVVLMFRTIDALKVFDLIWVITAGGPGFGSETLYVYAYNQAFKYLDIGYGSAVIVVFTLIVAGGGVGGSGCGTGRGRDRHRPAPARARPGGRRGLFYRHPRRAPGLLPLHARVDGPVVAQDQRAGDGLSARLALPADSPELRRRLHQEPVLLTW